MEPAPCALCGAPLSLSAGAPGCLPCLLNGGRDEIGAGQFHHYQLCRAENGARFEELGRGAMGITYRALDQNLDSPGALKVIGARFSNQPEARERFRREARAAAQLRHPNVASVYHYGETPEGHCFYAMELVEGETLEARVQRDGSLGAEVVLAIGVQVARALLAAEMHNLVHRDLKPSNLMLVPNEQDESVPPLVKVIDFGLARAITGEEEAGGLAPGGLTGTPGFASPEQFQSSAHFDVRSDIYSLGATLWFALCGRSPFAAAGMKELRARQLHEKPVTAVKAPEPLLRLLRAMLAPEPGKRPQSARELLLALDHCRRAISQSRRRVFQFAAGGAACLLLFGIATALRPQKAVFPEPPEKSIAVLPFQNLSDQKENVFFANGVQDEILSNLARIADLKVISRSAVLQYGSDRPRNLREIGRSLGVRHFVEGSVQRVGQRVRVVARLIDAQREMPLWSQTYDRDLADTFAVEDEIAEQIAQQLLAKVSPAERSVIEEKPTFDLTAYALYNQARRLDPAQPADRAEMIRLLPQAIARDPNFILAYCLLAKAYDLVYEQKNWDWQADRDQSAALAKATIDQALHLRPDRGEPHLALAFHEFTMARYASARPELDRALSLLPNDANAIFLSARLDRHENRWDDALREARRACELDPHRKFFVVWTVDTYTLMRRSKDGEEFVRQAERQNPAEADSFASLLVTLELGEGDLAAARAASHSSKGDVDPNADAILRYCARDFDNALKAIASIKPGPDDYDIRDLEAHIYRAQGQEAKAAKAFHQLQKRMMETSKPEARNEWYYQAVAELEAALGEKDKAIEDARRAMDLHPLATDPINGPQLVQRLAQVYAWTGERDRAIEQLQILVKVPSPVNYGDLHFNPDWDALRGDPRFEKLVALIKPK